MPPAAKIAPDQGMMNEGSPKLSSAARIRKLLAAKRAADVMSRYKLSRANEKEAELEIEQNSGLPGVLASKQEARRKSKQAFTSLAGQRLTTEAKVANLESRKIWNTASSQIFASHRWSGSKGVAPCATNAPSPTLNEAPTNIQSIHQTEINGKIRTAISHPEVENTDTVQPSPLVSTHTSDPSNSVPVDVDVDHHEALPIPFDDSDDEALIVDSGSSRRRGGFGGGSAGPKGWTITNTNQGGRINHHESRTGRIPVSMAREPTNTAAAFTSKGGAAVAALQDVDEMVGEWEEDIILVEESSGSRTHSALSPWMDRGDGIKHRRRVKVGKKVGAAEATPQSNGHNGSNQENASRLNVVEEFNCYDDDDFSVCEEDEDQDQGQDPVVEFAVRTPEEEVLLVRRHLGKMSERMKTLMRRMKSMRDQVYAYVVSTCMPACPHPPTPPHTYPHTHAHTYRHTHATHYSARIVAAALWPEASVRARARVHTHTHACARTHTHSHTLTHTLSHTLSHTPIHSYTHTPHIIQHASLQRLYGQKSVEARDLEEDLEDERQRYLDAEADWERRQEQAEAMARARFGNGHGKSASGLVFLWYAARSDLSAFSGARVRREMREARARL